MKSIKELEEIRQKTFEQIKVRLDKTSTEKKNILICGGTGCTSSKSPQIIENLNKLIKEKGIEDKVEVIKTGCFGLCAKGPIVIIYPDETFYAMVKPEDAEEIIEEDILKGNKIERLLVKEDKEVTHTLHELGFYQKQKRLALRNCGRINPENIDEYLALDGYCALQKVVEEMTPPEVITTVLDSGIRGRGGAGFPTGRKWDFASKVEADQKYVCCNADEGDPGAFMDRSVLEGDPHAVLEAMAIAGYAIGSTQGYIYVRAEYPIAVERLRIAIEQTREYGLLGNNIFGTDFFTRNWLL